MCAGGNDIRWKPVMVAMVEKPISNPIYAIAQLPYALHQLSAYLEARCMMKQQMGCMKDYSHPAACISLQH